jgi:hypothetical protein
MYPITFSLKSIPPRHSYLDTAKDALQQIHTMSAQTKARIELFAIVVTLILSVAATAKVWFILPDKVDRQERAIAELQTRREVDREILMKLVWQNDRIFADIAEIKAAVKAK